VQDYKPKGGEVMRIYEGVFLTRTSLDNEQRDSLIQKLEGIITQREGKILKKDEWGKKRLAYLVKKESEAHYTYMEFMADVDILDEMARVMRIDDNFMRHMFVKKED
jgi:small subunit ribosomal protein S6